MLRSAAELDPYHAHTRDDPYALYRELRDNHPVYREPDKGFYALSRYADVRAVLGQPNLFSSELGIILDDVQMAAALPMLVNLDPPRHEALRKLVSRAFTPRRVADLESHARKLAGEILDSVVPMGSFDVVADFAAPMPAIVISDLLGFPRSDRAQFRSWSQQLVKVSSDPSELEGAGVSGALMELYGYLDATIKERSAVPRDDLITALTQAEVDGERLSDAEQLGFCFLLLMAGIETTTNLIGNLVNLLHVHPDARARLVAEPERIPAALEEALRYESPVFAMFRTLSADAEVHGVPIAARSKVMLLFGSANRDEREFPEPDRFDIDRHPEHLAFGNGVHFCLGASLARVEARVAFEELLARVPEYSVLPGAKRVHSPIVRGFSSLPVEIG